MAKRIRTFLAVQISSTMREQLLALQQQLDRDADEVKWVEPENLHLTLKFLGDVDEQDLYAVCKIAQQSVAEYESFDMAVAGLGAFPSLERPRILWAGITLGQRELCEIHASLEQEFRREGYPGEDRPYTPHLTLGRLRRVREPARWIDMLARRSQWEAGAVRVRSIDVMASQLTPDGPIYAVMGRAKLRVN